MRSTLPLITILALASASHAQCNVAASTTLLDAYRGMKVSVPNQPVPNGSAWSFWMESFGSSPLIATYPSWVPQGTGLYGRPELPFGVPNAGPIYSNDPQIDEQGPRDRLMTMSGIMMHPGRNDSEDSIAVFSPQRTVQLSAAQIQAEVIGNQSNGVRVSVELTINGATSTLIAPTVIPYTLNTNTIINATIPTDITLNPGDRLTLRSNSNGVYTEDWLIANLRLDLKGGPVIMTPPLASSFCQNANGQLSILAAGSPTLSYQWRLNGENLSNGIKYSGVTTPILSISTIRPEDAGSYDCIVTSPCGTIASAAAELVVCAADFNCDGIVDFFDYLDFVAEFSGNGPNADFNADQVVDFFDYLDFVAFFSVGC